jgi:photosystem II stability/assembly factor-like uncharacterized protein
MPSTSIGDVAVAPSNPDVVWVGTGESNIFRASMAGVGVYKSTDAGRTWQHMGLTDTQTIARILVHPTNPDIVYVAASGHEWTDNAMRGVFKTTDGGKTWAKVLYRSPRRAPSRGWIRDPNTLYTATWQRFAGSDLRSSRLRQRAAKTTTPADVISYHGPAAAVWRGVD